MGARPPALAPFRVKSFRFLWPGDLMTSWAFEMETLVLGWYVLVETGSVLMLTVFGALLYPGTLIAPMFGVVGDRIGHRNLLCGMRAIYAALAATLMTLAFAGALTPALVLVIAALMGLVRPSDLAMRAALVAETMPAGHLMAAMGISRTTSDSARVAGALAGAGLFAALGMGPTYVVVTSLYVLGFLLTLRVSSVPVRSAVPAAMADLELRPTHWGDLREGVVYVWTTPHLLAAMWIAFMVNMTAFPLSMGLLPYVARDIYGSNQTGLAYLLASFAVGGLLASVGLSLFGARIKPGRMMVVYAAGWYTMLLVFAQMRSELGGIAFLMLAGVAQGLSMVPMSVMLLRTSSEALRGRVMGVRMLAIYSLPFGLLAAGALIGRIGFHATATLYAGFGLCFVIFVAVRWRSSLWPEEAPANAR